MCGLLCDWPDPEITETDDFQQIKHLTSFIQPVQDYYMYIFNSAYKRATALLLSSVKSY